MWWILAGAGCFVLALGSLLGWQIRARNMQRWLVPYFRQRWSHLTWTGPKEVHLLLCVADHYEPKANRASLEQGMARVQHWLNEYPSRFADFKDSDGRPPQH